MMRWMGLIATAIVATMTAGGAQAQSASLTRVQRPLNEVAPPPSVSFRLYKSQMLRLREEALAQQAADGGTLSPEHDAEIQRRIDRITQLYHRRLQGLPT